MPAWAIITIIALCVLVAAAAAVGAARELRLIATRRQFGPEFDRLARRVGARKARAELMERKQHVSNLSIRPLAPDRQRHFDASWTAAQEQFVEVPPEAVATAAQLVIQVAQERGYQVEDRAQLLADLSVNRARRIESFRRAEETAADPEAASTEDLRQAMLWYRAMFRDLAGSSAPSSPSSPARSSAVSPSPASPADGDRAAASRARRAGRLSRPSLRMPRRPRGAPRLPLPRQPAPPPQSLWPARYPPSTSA